MMFKKGWSTHVTMLVKTLNASTGDVLELGSGLFSTPMLHWLCKEQNRKLVTLENNEEYINFARQFRSNLHRIGQVESMDGFQINSHWGIVFVDHDFPYQDRGKDAIRFKDSADFIILHDTEREDLYGYGQVWKHFKYRYDWKECQPWTSVVSNFKDLSFLEKRGLNTAI